MEFSKCSISASVIGHSHEFSRPGASYRDYKRVRLFFFLLNDSYD